MYEKNDKKSGLIPGRYSTKRFFEEFSLSKKVVRRMLIIMGIGLVLTIGGILTEQTDILWIFLLVPGTILLLGMPGIMAAINKKHMALPVTIQLTLVIIGLFFKRMHWPGGTYALTIGLISLSTGHFFLMAKIYYTALKSNYFRIVGSVGSLFIAIMSLGATFKIMHWPGANMFLKISLVPSIIFTLIVLVTLPGSGYIKWKKEYKRIFANKLLIPWIFFLVLTLITTVLPRDLSSKFFYSERRQNKQIFEMTPYEPAQKEGMEPVQ
ncbi:MAG: hypothetical protein K9J30_13010 [Bacteroidales bacterium]|nr:hypothetical protein [Bacteroidales bacterium]